MEWMDVEQGGWVCQATGEIYSERRCVCTQNERVVDIELSEVGMHVTI